MKSSESKTTTTSHLPKALKASQPFFSRKDGESAFFSEATFGIQPFFQSKSFPVVQSTDNQLPSIQRSPEDWVTESTTEVPSEAAIAARINEISIIEAEARPLMDESRLLRNSLLSTCDASLTNELFQKREELIPLLEQSVSLTYEAVSDLFNLLENRNFSADDTEWYLDQMNAVAERGDNNKAYLTRLKRWRARIRIGEINQVLSSQSNPELAEEKRELSEFLMSSAIEYKQFAQPWGSVIYGDKSTCTTIGEAGCGPTSLAMVLQLLLQEDPEFPDTVTPAETSEYAADFGRVCNSGTYGPTMMGNIEESWPEYTGTQLPGITEVENEVRNGNLVIFLCKGCKGLTAAGIETSYDGHYMVLNGVSNDGQIFNVLDSGRNDQNDIYTISKAQLINKTNGFWIVTRMTP